MTSKELKAMMSIPGKRLTPEETKNGIAVSRLVVTPVSNASVTPWFKTMLQQFDGLNKSQGKPLMNDMPETKAEKKVLEFITTLLDKYSPQGKDQRYADVDEMDPSYYHVDNWRNFRSLRQLPSEKDQKKILRTKFTVFTKPLKDNSIVDKLKYDKVFGKAVSFVLELMPYFTSSTEIKEINNYFTSKHTNVGAPYFRNDKTLVDKNSGSTKTYADVTMEDAHKVTGIQDLYRVITLLNRFKYQSGRPVMATSRVANMYFNQILRPAIEVYQKHCTFMWTYNDLDFLKQVMIKNYEIGSKMGITMNNRDYSSYDSTITRDEKLLGFAMLASRIRDYRGKRLALQAAAYYAGDMFVVNGMDNRMNKIYPRVYSGEVFTNFIENIINAVESVYIQLLLDPDFTNRARKIIDLGGAPLLMMGDDNAIMEKKGLDDVKYSQLMKEHFGKTLYPIVNDKAKGEKGYFILQNRLFKSGNSYVFATPYPRVIQSMAIRERPVGLGYFGWCMMAFQQFERLAQVPDIQREVIRFWAQYDTDKFGTKLTPQQFAQKLKEEDQKAKAENKLTSADRKSVV